jgi:hypothetical protein
MNAIAAVPILVRALGKCPILEMALISALMGQWRWIIPSKARTICIGTNNQKSKSIGMAVLHWRWNMAVEWRGDGR